MDNRKDPGKLQCVGDYKEPTSEEESSMSEASSNEKMTNFQPDYSNQPQKQHDDDEEENGSNESSSRSN